MGGVSRPAVARGDMAWQPSLASLLLTIVACLAEAREASEGWWSQAGSNRRPRHCERRALPAELWPRLDRFEVIWKRSTIGAIYSPAQGQVKNGARNLKRPILASFCRELPLFAGG